MFHRRATPTFTQFIQRGAEALRQCRGRAVSVVVQKDDARLLAEHVVMERDHFQ